MTFHPTILGGLGMLTATWAPIVWQLARDYRCATIVDYGEVASPEPADLVVCAHILEYVEPEHVFAMVGRLAQLTRRALFVVVSLDNRRSVEWWRYLLAAHDFMLVCELPAGSRQWAAVLERPSCG